MQNDKLGACAYCNAKTSLTKEHVIPSWFEEATTSSRCQIFNARRPISHTRGGITIRDVCSTCNNGPLAALDGYGKSLYIRNFSKNAFVGESSSFEYDREMLTRWLLKVCFNSARANFADTEILSQYRDYILGNSNAPAEITLIAMIFSAIDWNAKPAAPTRRVLGECVNVERPKWFRLVQYRQRSMLACQVVQRQVYIDSYCFTLFVRDPARSDQENEIRKLTHLHLSQHPYSKPLSHDGCTELTTSDENAAETMLYHFSQYPTRFADKPETDPRRAAFDKDVAEGKANLMLGFSLEDALNGNISEVANILRGFTANRERVMGGRGTIAIVVEGYDDDPREVWDIPETTHLFCELLKECPYISFFAADAGRTMTTICACFCKAEGTSGQAIELDPIRVQEFLDICFKGLNDLTERFALSVEINKKVSESIFRIIDPDFHS